MNISDLMSGGIMKKLKSMQESVGKFQEELESLEVFGSAGATDITVNVSMNGLGEITTLEISDSAWKEGKPVVEDLLKGALNNAKSKLQQEKRSKLSKMGLPSSLESIGDLFAKSSN